MSRDFGKIACRIWKSRKFRELPDDATRMFYLYLHSNKHGNAVGCYELPKAYIMADLKWSEDMVSKAIKSCSDTLSGGYLIQYDDDEETVFLSKFLQFSPFQNPKHAVSGINEALKLPSSMNKLLVLIELLSAKHVDKTDRVEEIKAEIDTLSIRYQYGISTETETETETIIPDSKKSGSYVSKKGRKLKGATLDGFNAFWKAFAKPDGKAEAADSWLDLEKLFGKAEFPLEAIIAGAKLEAVARKYLPTGSTAKWAQGWLSGRRWESNAEEVQPEKKEPSRYDWQKGAEFKNSTGNWPAELAGILDKCPQDILTQAEGQSIERVG